jgi:hypothetical protein
MAEIPLSFAIEAAWVAARIAAYGDDSILSALTNMPPEALAIVSAPDKSVMFTMVLLYELNIWTTPHLSLFLLIISHLTSIKLFERFQL